jgi:hypothetical protein
VERHYQQIERGRQGVTEFDRIRSDRDAAHRLVTGRWRQIKADLAARSVPGRVLDTAKDGAGDFAETALDVARNNRGVIAATAAAIGLWVFRGPITRFAGQLWNGHDASDEPGTTEEHDQ